MAGKFQRTSLWIWSGAVMLIITSVLHFSGYFSLPPIPKQCASPADAFFAATHRPLWLFASAHWVLTAALCIVARKAQPGLAKTMVIACALTVLLDAILLYWFLGPFIGAAALGVSSALLLVGAFRMRAEVSPAL